jgi:hypothetical protein
MIWRFYGKKMFVLFFGHFWGGQPFDFKIFARKRPFKLKNWLLTYFCLGNPKKMFSGRYVDPSDSNLGGSCRNRLFSSKSILYIFKNFLFLINLTRAFDWCMNCYIWMGKCFEFLFGKGLSL